ncbi:glycosyl transferase family 1 [Mycolicibacterium sp. GF69]|uniref:glycosyltransferase n=1 Tax=Mycolicibacterium sp. GF69 TaxID=2267251 RepID=UPI000DCC3971|nr:glycosyltransferase [Mycolicibacterium sp. GF69]RAV13493.1 glycosyl transferase family 1 [Mycolicibacterium sp. GF69]
MKFVLASWGSRGDIEPCVAIGCELLRRGHEVRIAVSPDLVDFAKSAGLAPVPYGLETEAWMDVHRDLWTSLFRNPWRVQDLRRSWREVWAPVTDSWEKMSTTLTSLAEGADLLFTGVVFEELAANVAEYHDIPLATLHYFPARPHGQLVPFLPSPLTRFATTAYQWLGWRWTKKFEDVQRRQLGLPKATNPASHRMAERGSLEIQAYDQVCFPGLAAEWSRWDGQRPFVGTLTMELSTEADDEVTSWIAAGTPPIYFGFGSVAVESPAEMLSMISSACAELGERALVCSGRTDFSGLPHPKHVKVVDTMNHARIFPACRAVVHHGGAATMAAGLRAGVPTLLLSTWPDQSLRGLQIKRLRVGTARRLSSSSEASLVADLRRILSPQYVSRAREVAREMNTPAESVATATDCVENFARLGRVG